MSAAELEKICLSFKGVTQDIKWGHDLCYSVGSKMFCVTSATGAQNISFKTTPEEFSILTERNGIIPAPYVARHFWVMVENSKVMGPKEWKQRIKQSYELVFEKLPKKVKSSIH